MDSYVAYDKPITSNPPPPVEDDYDYNNPDFFKEKIRVTFNDNYEGGNIKTVKVAKGYKVAKITPIRPYHTFGGWYMELDTTNP